MAIKAKKKATGRAPGTPNKKSAYLRDEIFMQMRCSKGMNEVVNELVTSGQYKSRADVIHEAVQILGYRKLPGTFYWLDKIQ